MIEYFVKGTVVGNPLEERTKKFKDNKGKEKEKTGYFLTIKEPHFYTYDAVNKKFVAVDPVKLGELLKEDMAPFIPQIAEKLINGEEIEYANYSTTFEPKVVDKRPDVTEPIVYNNAAVMAQVKNTYFNSLAIIEQGSEWNPFDEMEELPFN